MFLSASVVLLVIVATGVPSFARAGVLSHELGDWDLGVLFKWNGDSSDRTERDVEAYTETDFYDLPIHRINKRATTQYRSGKPTETHSCDEIRAVPSYLRTSSGMPPTGLDNFYQKYTEAYGIPVLGSSMLPDDALKRACYVTRFLFADHSGIREWYYKFSGRIAVMGVNETTTMIPEHSYLDPTWDTRARGLGATEGSPICTGAEENVLCYSKDRYGNEDILLHEMCHGVHWLGARYAIDGWNDRLIQAHKDANSTGLWSNTYALKTFREYFAEGAQSYFDVNAFADPPNGVHNNINTNAKLKDYDPTLYKLISEVFPCGNTYLKRCTTTRVYARNDKTNKVACAPSEDSDQPDQTVHCRHGEAEMAQALKMNCNQAGGTIPTSCIDKRLFCSYMARRGDCITNPSYMLTNCRKSCNSC